MLCSGILLPLTSGAGLNVSLTESSRSELKQTVVSQGLSTLTDSTSSTQAKWKIELTTSFTSEDWSKLGRDGTITIKIGKQTLEKKIEAGDGFSAEAKTFKFNLTQPVVVSEGYKYLRLPSDPPPSPQPAPGTKQVIGSGTLEFKGSQLKITLSSSGRAAPSLASGTFLSLGDGGFEGKLPFDVTICGQTQHADLIITGSMKRRDYSREDVSGYTAQMSLSGKV